VFDILITSIPIGIKNLSEAQRRNPWSVISNS